ncbi:MAG TPA: hypothetical protein VM689_05330 [Aliidongia sp.]|nr:hypothetical protein [Aliidongia sp.]
MTIAAPDTGKLRPLEPNSLRPRLRLPQAHEAVLDDWERPALLLGRLIELELFAEAARYLAYALPEREAVWWACMCVAHTALEPSVPERHALDAAEAWVRRPDEEMRREAAWAAAAAGYGVPGAWPALAAYWSRRSKPLDMRGGRGVETAIDRAARRDRPERRAERLRRFIASGCDISSGGAGRLPPEAN